MTLINRRVTCTITCDVCNKAKITAPKDNFHALIVHMRKHNWFYHSIPHPVDANKRIWEHICPKCEKKAKRKWLTMKIASEWRLTKPPPSGAIP